MKKDKYLQIFNYLLEFSKLRSNPVRDIEASESQYPDKILLSDIPTYDIFDCVTFPTYNEDSEYWIKICKPKNEPQLPKFPILSVTLNDWIIYESLTDENGLPKLNESIIKDSKPVLLADNPKIKAEFEVYLNNKWLDDLEQYKKEFDFYQVKFADYEKQMQTYKHFFSIYNKVKQFGDEFELIIGAGLMFFQENPNTPRICRHLITSKAEITFEFSLRDSILKVFPAIDNEIQIETDAIIDLYEQFEAPDIMDAEKKVVEFLREKNITDNPFDNLIKEAIQIFADRIRSDGHSVDDIAKPKEISKKPTLYFAPALLLRKRNTRSLTALYQKIIEDINNSNEDLDIPTINDIIGLSDVFNHEESEGENEPETAINSVDDTIYFPKKSNDEQIEIVKKVLRNKKVLVQGPPGTGKSHTISNLVCHLLANGKKVLVTAQTERALKVLRNLMPPEFSNLTVNLFSGDTSSIQELNASVNAINEELSRINLGELKAEISKLKDEFTKIKESKALTRNQLLIIREKSTRSLILNPRYRGTLIEIAEKVENDLPQFLWFKDNYSDISNPDLSNNIADFYALTDHFNEVDCSVFSLEIPKKEKLLTIEELSEYRDAVNDLVQKDSSKSEHIVIKCNNYQVLKEKLHALHELISAIESNSLPFKFGVINDYSKKLNIWNDKLDRSTSIISELQKLDLKQLDRSVQITYPPDYNIIQLKNDAQTLLDYLNDGNVLSGLMFNLKKAILPKEIKEKLHFIDAVKVNGSPTDTVSEFEAVLRDIRIKQDFEELSGIWDISETNGSKTYCDSVKFFQQINTDTLLLIDLLKQSNTIKAQVQDMSSIKIKNFTAAEVQSFIDEIDYNYLLSKTRTIKEKIAVVEKYLSGPNIHTVSSEILNAIDNIDVDAYDQIPIRIDKLNTQFEKYQTYRKLQAHLKFFFPLLIDEILDGSFDSLYLKQIENAICLNHAMYEIKNLLEKDSESNLSLRLSELEKREEQLIAQIASKKAWHFVLEDLNKNFSLRQHLQAWVLAVKKIGKTGKGKRALKFRKEAQQQMDKCKDSVPCWIMPLFKVAETINPQQGMYDYVIIDEASQLGADAIFLLYISKNIIIVGDDKQTSPEYVGVDANTMTPHIMRHLKDIPFANFYGTEFSFFDHAKMFCKEMTVLREHFRCMPEIIEFCNKYFYAPELKSLYPLRQYSDNRLDPLRTRYCQNGYIDGSYQNITNKIEAESIADQITTLIKDERYKDKTFGVIALQGNAQAKLIEGKLLDKIGSEEIQKRKIICGNSASYQGDERDVMFLSLITANNHNRSALVKPEDERRFNVAVSRARDQVWLFHSVLPDDLSNKEDLRYKLLSHFLSPNDKPRPSNKIYERSLGNQPHPFESWFEVDVYNDIVSKDYSVIPQYEVVHGKYRIDLVVILSNGTKIAVECDGDKYHGPEQFQNDLMRQKVLERCGWQFFRVRGAEYYSNRNKALEPLWILLRKNDTQKEEPKSTNKQESQSQESFNNETSSKPDQSEENHNFTESDIDIETSEIKADDEQDFKQPVKDEKTEHKIKVAPDLYSYQEFLVFSSLQNVYKVRNRGFDNISQIISEIEFDSGDKPIYITGTNNYSGYIIIAFQNGKTGKISLNAYQTKHNRKKLENAYNGESKLIFIEVIEHDIDLVSISNIKKVVLFNTSLINPVESRNTKGVQVMKQKDGSYMSVVKRAEHTKFQNADYYRKEESLNVVGYYLKQGDEI